MPIAEMLYHVLFNGVDAKEAVERLKAVERLMGRLKEK